MGRHKAEHSLPDVKAVRISCHGEREVGVPRMEQCNIPPSHDVFKRGDVSVLSKLVGIPIRICKVWSVAGPPAAATNIIIFTVGRNHYLNGDVGSLMQELNPKFTRNFDDGAFPFMASRRWAGHVGSVLVVRVDRKPLYPHHLKTLIRYAREIESLAEAAMPYNAISWLSGRIWDTAQTPLSADEVLSHITPTEFKEFYMAQCNLKQKLRYPTPWSWPAKNTQVSKRKAMHHEYYHLSLESKAKDTESWRERVLLAAIQKLASRLERYGEHFRDVLSEVVLQG